MSYGALRFSQEKTSPGSLRWQAFSQARGLFRPEVHWRAGCLARISTSANDAEAPANLQASRQLGGNRHGPTTLWARSALLDTGALGKKPSHRQAERYHTHAHAVH